CSSDLAAHAPPDVGEGLIERGASASQITSGKIYMVVAQARQHRPGIRQFDAIFSKQGVLACLVAVTWLGRDDIDKLTPLRPIGIKIRHPAIGRVVAMLEATAVDVKIG